MFTKNLVALGVGDTCRIQQDKGGGIVCYGCFDFCYWLLHEYSIIRIFWPGFTSPWCHVEIQSFDYEHLPSISGRLLFKIWYNSERFHIAARCVKESWDIREWVTLPGQKKLLYGSWNESLNSQSPPVYWWGTQWQKGVRQYFGVCQ